ncbi:hypothetical protein [Pandoraea sputorum]|uniref:hypothetical protein n=1 Tax=Pandoraea sputorum TaxID=93222 RepID=UPI0012415979|nr:hypothetical protein [Pandoraea sputorum]
MRDYTGGVGGVGGVGGLGGPGGFELIGWLGADRLSIPELGNHAVASPGPPGVAWPCLSTSQ